MLRLNRDGNVYYIYGVKNDLIGANTRFPEELLNFVTKIKGPDVLTPPGPNLALVEQGAETFSLNARGV
jgi:hypothetical protein